LIGKEELRDLCNSIRKPLELSFGPACEGEKIVYGASMPGFGARSIPESIIKKWIDFMKKATIVRVCSLIAQSELSYYEVDLLETYRKAFGGTKVLHAPIEDRHLCDIKTLKRIMLFLREADRDNEPTVVHCAGGRGRTGLIPAAYLVYGRGFSIEEALEAVKRMGRNPYEAVVSGKAREEELYELLRFCKEGR